MEPNRVSLVYRTLGQILNSPQSFGLGDRAPKPLVEVLTAARQSLREEFEEENNLSDEDWLSEELAQDADQPESRTVKLAEVDGAGDSKSPDVFLHLHPAAVSDAEMPRPAIRPYPSQYVWNWKSHDGTHFTVRPIRPDDESLLVELHQQLSDSSVYSRYFLPLKLDVRISHERLLNKCCIDYDREIALVAEYTDGDGRRHVAGIARMIRRHAENIAEVAFLVVDKFQNRGLGTYLLERTIEVARSEGVGVLEAATLSENFNMKEIFVRAGFRFTPPESGVVSARLEL